MHKRIKQESLFDFILNNSQNIFKLYEIKDYERIEFIPVIKSDYIYFINDNLHRLESNKFTENYNNTFDFPFAKLKDITKQTTKDLSYNEIRLRKEVFNLEEKIKEVLQNMENAYNNDLQISMYFFKFLF